MSQLTPSPFAPKGPLRLLAVPGFDMAVAEAGIRYKDRTDLWVLRGQPGTDVAGVFTKNQCPGSPIVWSREALQYPVDTTQPRLIIVNSGTANVFCGEKGRQAVKETAQGVADIFGCDPHAVFIASTGVIGQPLDAAKVTAKLPEMKAALSADIWGQSAAAIMTTDTYAKGASVTTHIDGQAVTITGITKGSGMIAPDMATMLGFIATDAAISQPVLQHLLSEFTYTTFNAITVDSDTSTSDTVLLAASGAANHEKIERIDDPNLDDFKSALQSVMLDLAHQIVKDGEGAQKFITIRVTGAMSDPSARNIGLSIANSPLVKTAIAGEDANWGRIVMAVGKAGEPAERDTLSIWIGPHLLASKGELAADYTEEAGASYMMGDHIEITVDLGLGQGEFTVWSCDLTHGYIDINADYRS